jgi:hypothetical protein
MTRSLNACGLDRLFPSQARRIRLRGIACARDQPCAWRRPVSARLRGSTSQLLPSARFGFSTPRIEASFLREPNIRAVADRLRSAGVRWTVHRGWPSYFVHHSHFEVPSSNWAVQRPPTNVCSRDANGRQPSRFPLKTSRGRRTQQAPKDTTRRMGRTGA